MHCPYRFQAENSDYLFLASIYLQNTPQGPGNAHYHFLRSTEDNTGAYFMQMNLAEGPQRENELALEIRKKHPVTEEYLKIGPKYIVLRPTENDLQNLLRKIMTIDPHTLTPQSLYEF